MSARGIASRFVLLAAVVALVTAACTSSAPKEQPTGGAGAKPFAGQTLVVSAWSGPYARGLREIFVPPFEQATGAKVVIQDEWGEIVDKIVAAPANDPPFDLTIGEGYTMCYGAQQHLWLPIDYSRIPNAKDVFPSFRSAENLDCKARGVPFGYGYEVLGYYQDVLGFTPTSWADMWSPQAQGKIAMDQGFFNYALAAAAFALGDDPASLPANGPVTDAVFNKMKQLDVRLWYTSGAQYVNAFKTKDIGIAQMYIEDAAGLAREDPNFRFVIPQEGAMGWVDYYMMVRGTQHEDLAYAFLDSLLDPTLQTKFAAEHLYWMSNEKYTPPDVPGVPFPKTNAEASTAIHMFDYDQWLPHFFDEDGFYTKFSQEILGQ